MFGRSGVEPLTNRKGQGCGGSWPRRKGLPASQLLSGERVDSASAGSGSEACGQVWKKGSCYSVALARDAPRAV